VTEFLKTFGATAGTTIQQVATFVLLIVPGFVSLRVYEFKRGASGRNAADVLVDLIVYSMASDVLILGAVQLVSRLAPLPLQTPLKVVVVLVGLVVVPSALALALVTLRTGLVRAGFGSAVDAGRWSNMVRRVSEAGITPGVILTLKDGRKVGGRARDYGYHAINEIRDDDVLVGEAWTIDQERGTFIEPVPGSFGMAVPNSEYRTIELYALPQPANRASQPETAGT
jgi:Family of unknown function (DUF6338)